MKPKSEFVVAMLALCAVSRADLVQRESINADHVRLMDKCMTSEAKELISDFTALADEAMEEFVCKNTPAFIESGLASLTREERILMCCIYGSQGRELEISDSGMIVHPSHIALQKKRRLERKKYKQVA